MNRSRSHLLTICWLSAMATCAGSQLHAQMPLGTSFTYQGRLVDAGEPANGPHDIVFTLHAHPTDPAPVGTPVLLNRVPVSEGLFTVLLNFGEGVFTGDARWLEIEVEGVTLSPRQAITPAPYALALPGLRTIQTGASPNVIGGFAGNIIDMGVVGATIAGGGDADFQGFALPNHVLADYAFLGGGRANTISGEAATIGGGLVNTASGHSSTIGGGGLNEAAGENAAIAGGSVNTASGVNATIGGGSLNKATGENSAIGGGFSNIASATTATISGGENNVASAFRATVGGGTQNTAGGNYATVPGGLANEAMGPMSFAAGRLAKALHTGTFVWADSIEEEFSSTGGNQFLIRASGGVGIGTTSPVAQLHVVGSVVAGNAGNDASGDNSFVSGGGTVGFFNSASGDFSFVAGGLSNSASGSRSFVAGSGNAASGFGSFVAGSSNQGNGIRSFVGGGNNNEASGTDSFIGGGVLNVAAGSNSFAAGTRAKANHNGAFVWADSTNEDFASTIPDVFLIRASNGVAINHNAPFGFDLAVNGSAAKPGGGSWSNFSDARLKQDIALVEPGILERLLQIRAYHFTFTDEAIDSRFGLPGAQIGLIAQDVQGVFPDWVDADEDGYLYVTERNVTAIVVEALRELRAEKDAEIDALRAEMNAEIDSLQMANHDLESRLAALERRVGRLATTHQKGTNK